MIEEHRLKDYLISLGFTFYIRNGYDLTVGDRKYNIRVLHDISRCYVFIITDLSEDVLSQKVISFVELMQEIDFIKKVIRKQKIEKLIMESNKNSVIDTETLEAKLRNKLSPIYGLADIVLALEDDFSPELLEIAIRTAKQSISNRDEIDTLLERIDGNRRKDNPVDTSSLYGKYVQMDDRFETVHIWSKELEERNAGRWRPIEITEEVYLKEKAHSWNQRD